MLEINPHDYPVSEEEIRKRLKLPKIAIVIPFGYEKIKNNALINLLRSTYDRGSLFVRTRPDFMVCENQNIYFVEAKQNVKNVEATQLLFNKFYEKIGIKVIYSFPDYDINAFFIPINKVIIPQKYREKFDSNLKMLFEEEGVRDFEYLKGSSFGSGDPFTPIDEEELRGIALYESEIRN